MNTSLPEKEKLLSMLTEIYDDLEELELVLESSFSDLRLSLHKDKLDKLSSAELKLSKLEKDLDTLNSRSPEDSLDHHANSVKRSLKLEMGF